ncbi:hypothetical protein BHE74_00057412 [Ensete ventricosum]|nr:hypothetical protein BHE74_00057412 [Ensete ventricosum]
MEQRLCWKRNIPGMTEEMDGAKDTEHSHLPALVGMGPLMRCRQIAKTVEPAPWSYTLLGGVKIKLEAKNESRVRWGKEQSHSQCVHFVSILYYHDDVDGVVDNNQDEDGGGTIVVTTHSVCTALAPL